MELSAIVFPRDNSERTPTYAYGKVYIGIELLKILLGDSKAPPLSLLTDFEEIGIGSGTE